MIFVQRPSKPAYLDSPKVLKAIEALKNNFYYNERQERIRFLPEILIPIKPDLAAAFHHKCAYCEQRLYQPHQGEIDYFRPRSGVAGNKEYLKDHYWWLAYNWDNLYLSCSTCNRVKGNQFPLSEEASRAPIGDTSFGLWNEATLLIDPCREHPEEHLTFRNTGEIVALSTKGLATIQLLALDREELNEKRKQEIDIFLQTLDNVLRDQSPQQASAIVFLVMDLFNGSGGAQQFAGAVKTAYSDWYDNHEEEWNKILKLSSSHAVNKRAFPPPPVAAQHHADLLIDEALVNESITTRSFSIKSITIRNFKKIAHLTLDIPEAATREEGEAWLLLLGDNGVGKTSVLQAIAMTLCGAETLHKLGLTAHEFLKYGQQDGSIYIQSFENDEPVILRFNQDGFMSELAAPPTFLLGYGATRLLPKGLLQPRKNVDRRVNINNLFDYSYSLSDANKWLATVDPKEMTERIFPALLDMLNLPPDRKLIYEERELKIDDGVQKFSIERISDGYKSVIAIACDIMKTLSVEKAGYHTAKGIVLIDELGNHLHPAWRMKIVPALRNAFPRLQFIVSTHEPLCLRGIKHGEAVVLMKDQQSNIVPLADLPDHTLLRVDQLLTSDLFGLMHTLDEATTLQFEEYYRLLAIKAAARTEEEQEKINTYTRELAGKDLSGNTPQLQILYEIIHEQYARQLTDNHHATKAALKESTKEAVKAILANKNLDWL
ncbi:AAA family ATPase [Chitinophaga nivalis]|uniref:AAA family ATPase n=1 Tax=Chitinophaga nivalis TaxID=2991709 RepID=A0ABT3IKT5_9BACT|nr:AAA family ATPase [Chitinophaga nivalis]MCW3465889.1 AAA family ATPase [Chitinophaga nivalis]MCW3484420.1 AAA family ATPase [Chitinophaga nivalis]